jgi:iron(II)-dependent oxidoreductase
MMSLRSLWRNGNGSVETPSRSQPRVIDSDPLRACLQLRRFGRIAAFPQHWGDAPGFSEALEEALSAIDDLFALVPEGFVSLAQGVNDAPGGPEIDLETRPYLLARVPVTNQEYQGFVDSGGYEDLEYWPEDIWPHLISFKDLTDHPAPRYWRGANMQEGTARQPVVGISYYEASAYAQWAGFRLPTEGEWQMAASWRIRSAAHGMRSYPWGQAFDQKRCNLWSSALHRIVDVDEFAAGVAPNGVLQLIGNVWEWTSSDLDLLDELGNPILGDMLMKGVRGGAFDTYFTAQATSHFRSGLPCLSRTHNTGFRLAMDVAAGA